MFVSPRDAIILFIRFEQQYVLKTPESINLILLRLSQFLCNAISGEEHDSIQPDTCWWLGDTFHDSVHLFDSSEIDSIDVDLRIDCENDARRVKQFAIKIGCQIPALAELHEVAFIIDKWIGQRAFHETYAALPATNNELEDLEELITNATGAGSASTCSRLNPLSSSILLTTSSKTSSSSSTSSSTTSKPNKPSVSSAPTTFKRMILISFLA